MLRILLWLGWGALLGGASLMTLFMMAFGDEPRTRRAVQRAITPIFGWIALVVLLGVSLINRAQWWAGVMAYLLALSPPVVLMMLIAALMRWDRRASDERTEDRHE